MKAASSIAVVAYSTSIRYIWAAVVETCRRWRGVIDDIAERLRVYVTHRLVYQTQQQQQQHPLSNSRKSHEKPACTALQPLPLQLSSIPVDEHWAARRITQLTEATIQRATPSINVPRMQQSHVAKSRRRDSNTSDPQNSYRSHGSWDRVSLDDWSVLIKSTLWHWIRSVLCGLTENAGHEIDGPIFEAFARHEIAGHERLDYFLRAQAGDLSLICFDLPQSSNRSKNRHKRLLSLFRLSVTVGQLVYLMFRVSWKVAAFFCTPFVCTVAN